ncbi:MAG TPA: DUF4199 domain-containing protein [Puia sp.]|jgi:hypothetical protein|nr:DUF4199 domain-containing protein [Puia sp.]
MKKIVLVCGVIGGLITTVWMVVLLIFYNGHDHIDNGEIYGYGSMILAFSLIYVGVRNFRNKYNNGVISFGKAFRIGLYITLIASTIYVGTWQVIYYGYARDFGKVYSESKLAKLKASGVSEEAYAKQKAEMDDWVRLYDKPAFNIGMTYMEILPVGLLVSLITALILKRKSARTAPSGS